MTGHPHKIITREISAVRNRKRKRIICYGNAAEKRLKKLTRPSRGLKTKPMEFVRIPVKKYKKNGSRRSRILASASRPAKKMKPNNRGPGREFFVNLHIFFVGLHIFQSRLSQPVAGYPDHILFTEYNLKVSLCQITDDLPTTRNHKRNSLMMKQLIRKMKNLALKVYH